MLSYIGGKKFHAKYIQEYFPKDIKTYCEPFSGAFWIYFMSTINPTTTIYNDLNPFMSNLFRCASEDSNKLKSEMLKYEPQNPDLFLEFRDLIFGKGMSCKIDGTDYELAAKFAYIQTQIFAGNTLNSRSKITLLDKTKYRSKYEQLIDKMSNQKYVNKLSNITNVENLDFTECIMKYDSEDTLFYVDPPYFNCESYYTIETDDVHKRLSETIAGIKGKAIISYYDFDGVEELYPKDKYNYNCYDINCQNGNRKRSTTESRKEIIIRNFI